MERQVRLAAGSLVLTGLLTGQRWKRARLLSAGVAGGPAFSALTDTLDVARVPGPRCPTSSPATDLEVTLTALSHG